MRSKPIPSSLMKSSFVFISNPNLKWTIFSIAMYVGSERRRYVIPTQFLSLLKKVEEVFGFQMTGYLIISCDVSFFMFKVLARDDNGNGFSTLDLDDFAAMLVDLVIDSSTHCEDYYSSSCHSFTPLLQKAKIVDYDGDVVNKLKC
ncbi:hypothetical protein L1987_30253 [Smallanthus sonchifolius]|uniref:Uncharacterized protein n=1 Tax=Smallanthus sonchifolius TaxID=185202 RepID=A0ACB9I2X5_9ASTR|nr:hypothetical protein L1987_30253 [Smallanthus sonchifolius]